MKKRKVLIIDNSSIDEEIESRYCGVPELLVRKNLDIFIYYYYYYCCYYYYYLLFLLLLQIKMFAKFHSKYNSPSIGFSFERVVANRIKMGWRTVDNYLDDGVFVMSHMNMFFGESEGKWDYGLLKESKEQTKQLNTLRLVTCLSKILYSI